MVVVLGCAVLLGLGGICVVVVLGGLTGTLLKQAGNLISG